MDLLFKRYASPFLLMDEMIAVGNLQDFITYLLKDEQEALQWDVWLHKVHDMDFNTYKAKCAEANRSYAMTTKQVDRTIEKSKGILKKFQPK